MVFEKIREIIAEQTGKDESEITLETNVKDDLDADSLDLFQIINDIEDEFDVTVDDPESIEATIFYIGARTIFDPMFDESFQTEYSGDLTTAVINSVKGNDSKQELDSVYSKVLDSFVRTYGG